MKNVFMVECPCCHGAKEILVYEVEEDRHLKLVARVTCSHCEGKGEIEAEVAENGSQS
jgi:hypothetical protein